MVTMATATRSGGSNQAMRPKHTAKIASTATVTGMIEAHWDLRRMFKGASYNFSWAAGAVRQLYCRAYCTWKKLSEQSVRKDASCNGLAPGLPTPVVFTVLGPPSLV